MKDCNYYKEQIMLEFYNETFDNEIYAHIDTCMDCKNFKNELTVSLSLKNRKTEFKFEKIKKNIIKANEKKKINIFRKNIFKFAAAAVFLFIIFSITQKQQFSNSGKKNIITQPVEIKTILNGGDNLIIEAFSDLESELEQMETELKSFYEVI